MTSEGKHAKKSNLKHDLAKYGLSKRFIRCAFWIGAFFLISALLSYPKSGESPLIAAARAALAIDPSDLPVDPYFAKDAQFDDRDCPMVQVTPSEDSKGDAFKWIAIPNKVEINFFKDMQSLMDRRPFFMRDNCINCDKAVHSVLEATREVKPCGVSYDPKHPHYEGFWLVAHTMLEFVPECGLMLEFGVAHGSSATLTGRISSKRMRRDRILYGFDTFTGMPEAWRGFTKGAFAWSSEGRLPPVPSNVRLIKGLFNDTLPGFLRKHPGPLAYVNIDCDLYRGAVDVLMQIRDRLLPGTILHFHELSHPGSHVAPDELRALFILLNEKPTLKLEMLNIVAWSEAVLLRVVSV